MRAWTTDAIRRVMPVAKSNIVTEVGDLQMEGREAENKKDELPSRASPAKDWVT